MERNKNKINDDLDFLKILGQVCLILDNDIRQHNGLPPSKKEMPIIGKDNSYFVNPNPEYITSLKGIPRLSEIEFSEIGFDKNTDFINKFIYWVKTKIGGYIWKKFY